MSALSENDRRAEYAAVARKTVGALVPSTGATVAEMMQSTDIPKSTVEKYLKMLLAEGVLHRTQVRQGSRGAFVFYPISVPLPEEAPRLVTPTAKPARPFDDDPIAATLAFIVRNPDCTPGAICTGMHRAKSTVSSYLAALAADGLIFSTPQPSASGFRGSVTWRVVRENIIQRDEWTLQFFGPGPARVVDYDALRMEA